MTWFGTGSFDLEMHNNLNMLEMKRVLELQPFIPNANRLNIWQLNNLSHLLKVNLSKVLTFFLNQHPIAGRVVRKWLVVM